MNKLYRNFQNKKTCIPVILFFCCYSLNGQTHQDCINAITVCTNTYMQTNASAGYGNIQEVSPNSTCLGNGETNSTWYIFSIQNPGSLLFQVSPLNTQDDYDFVLYKFNGNCSDIINGVTQPLRCNYSSVTGNTGLAQGISAINSPSNGVNQCAPISVIHGEKYLLLVNNFTATNSGYSLTFSGSASIDDTEPPSLTSTNITSCGPKTAYIYFNESIKSSSIAGDGSDFKLTGPSNINIDSAVSLSNNTLTPGIKIYFSYPITVPGNYTIRLKNGSDGNTVSDFCDNFIPVNSAINFDILYSSPSVTISSIVNADCNFSSGSATAYISGGTAPYTYNWNSIPTQNTLSAVNLAPGNYQFTVTDANGCSAHAGVNIKGIGNPVLRITTTPDRCDSVNNGSATVFVTGSMAPFTYLWNTVPSQTTATATALAAGIYSVTVTGANGCSASITANVSIGGLPTINISHTNVSCNGLLPGSAIAIANGNSPFIYQWSNGETSASIMNLSEGVFTVTVTDISGCTKKSSVKIDRGGMQLTVSATDLQCGNVHNGTATVSTNQFLPPLSYLWSTNPPQTTATAFNLAEGNWKVIVTDSLGCKDSITATVGGPPPLVVNVTTANAGCTFNNGSATAVINGGTAPYSCLWNTLPIQNTSLATNLFAGTYLVTVTDQDNCTASCIANIGNWDGPHGFISDVVDATCNLPNGKASVVNVNGNGPFNYVWYTLPLQFTSTAISLPEGLFTVKITDHEGCLSFLNVKINSIEAPELSLCNLTNASCEKSDGSASVVVANGTAPFTFQWQGNPSQITATAVDLPSGNNLCIITDATGCKDSLLINIPENTAKNDFTFTTSCLNEPATFSGITDYTGSVTWSWDFGDSSSTQNSIINQKDVTHVFSSSGNYKVTLFINGGCATDTLIRLLEESVKPQAAFTYTPDKLTATSPVHFNYTGSPVTEWFWNFGDDKNDFNANPSHVFDLSNNYHVVLYVTDGYGCKDTTSENLFIDEPPAVFIPGAFTPNDDGINDQLIIPSLGLTSCDFKIFDRWGGLVFQSSDPGYLNHQGWNGFLNGNKVPEGTYVYMFSGKLDNGKPVFKKGTLSVIL